MFQFGFIIFCTDLLEHCVVFSRHLGTVPARQSAHKRDGMDPAAQLEFVRDNVDADMQFILGESGVSLENKVAIGRHYGTLRKFSALGDDRASIRTSCLQDFAIPGDTPASRAQTASVVAAWETAKEYMAKEIELKAEAKVLGQPRVLQIHERQAMLRAVEAVHGQLNDSECPSSDYLSLKAEETECNEPSAAPLDEILSKQASSNSQIQSAVDNTGHIRVTRTKTKAKMPVSTEEYRKIMKVEMYAWLAMSSRYKAKHWLHGLTAAPFQRFTEYILGDRVYGIQIPAAASDAAAQRVKPDWSIVLAYEHKLRKEAMKLVLAGHSLSDALESVIKNPDSKRPTSPHLWPCALRCQRDNPTSLSATTTKAALDPLVESSRGFRRAKGRDSKEKPRENQVTQD